MTDRKAHWETVYRTKQPHEVSWTQGVAQPSLDLILDFDLPKTARILDVGGGASPLVDGLLDAGYRNITVLDISEAALQQSRERLGARAESVTWVVADLNNWEPDGPFDLWHDRAVFHFLTDGEAIARYAAVARQSVTGYLVLGTFSADGPVRCSGLDVTRYAAPQLAGVFAEGFEPLHSFTEDHRTPFGTTQAFLFGTFRRRP